MNIACKEFKALCAQKSDQQIAAEFECNITAVQKLRLQYGIRRRKQKSTYVHIKDRPFSRAQRGALIGTLLGDACIGKGRYGCFLVIEHTVKAEQYVQLKHKIFQPYVIQDIAFRPPQMHNWSKVGSYRFSTIIHPEFFEFREIFYPQGKKVVPKDEILNELTVAGLALWFMDDGTLIKSREYRFCTYQFSLEDQKRLRQMLRKKFQIWTSILKDKTADGYFLYVTAKSRPILENLLRGFIVPCMQYKLRKMGSPETTRPSSYWDAWKEVSQG